MSIDLSWPPLPDTLPSTLLKHLNEHLKTSQRPSFIGPVEITSLEFGDSSPDIELIDMRDIYRDFLEDDSDSDGAGGDDTQKHTKTGNLEDEDEEEDFEWVSRRAAVNSSEEPNGSFAYEHLPPHVRMGYGSSPSMDLWGSTPSPGVGLMDFARPAYSAMYRHPLEPPVTPVSRPSPSPVPPKKEHTPAEEPSESVPPPNENPHPNLQLHFSIHWESNLRLSLTTSLLINYPSPGFMSLPIKLSVTGLVFDGEVVVAYEGDPASAKPTVKPAKTGRRVHICIMDDQDPYAPAAKKFSPSASTTLAEAPIPEPMLDASGDFYGSGVLPSRSAESKHPVGQRILPNIFIESEIGQADKHVLKNVTRVERFIQDAIRKTVEEELVWPNFWTGVLGE